MIEQLLGGGNSPGLIAASGPGPKTLLAGNAQLGYFGRVTSTVLFAAWELETAGGLEIGTESSSVLFWLKFAYKGKILYIAGQPIRTLVGWTDLYNCGLVYGVKDYGTYPIGSPGIPQYNVMTKIENGASYYLFPRLMTGFTSDPQPAAPSQAAIDDSEYSQLFARCVVGANGSIADKWDNLTTSQVGYANYIDTWTKESLSTDLTTAQVRGSGTLLGVSKTQLKANAAVTVTGWRPVLELIPVPALKDPFALTSQGFGLMSPSVVGNQLAANQVYDPQNVKTTWPTKQPVITGITFTAVAAPPVSPIGSSNMALNPFTVNGAYTA